MSTPETSNQEVLQRLQDIELRLQALERKAFAPAALDAPAPAGISIDGLPPLPESGARADGLSPEVHELAQQGKLIQAIKLHREQTGLGLAEAKAAVERHAR